VAKLISFGQAMKSTGSEHHQITHAAIAIDWDTVIESQGSGLEMHSLSEDNYKYKYAVFRLKDDKLPEAAAKRAESAFQSQQESGGVKHEYSVKGAIKSLFKTKNTEKTELLYTQKAAEAFDGGGQCKFFCSAFAAACYQAAATDLGLYSVPGLDIASNNFEPSALYKSLSTNPQWEYIGISDKGGNTEPAHGRLPCGRRPPRRVRRGGRRRGPRKARVILAEMLAVGKQEIGS
jgi:hypothetical protein